MISSRNGANSTIEMMMIGDTFAMSERIAVLSDPGSIPIAISIAPASICPPKARKKPMNPQSTELPMVDFFPLKTWKKFFFFKMISRKMIAAIALTVKSDQELARYLHVLFGVLFIPRKVFE